jgi:hypothetical protein
MNSKLYTIQQLLHIKSLVFWVLLLSFFKPLAQETDSLTKLPPTQWTRPRKIDVKHIALDLIFDWL